MLQSYLSRLPDTVSVHKYPGGAEGFRQIECERTFPLQAQTPCGDAVGVFVFMEPGKVGVLAGPCVIAGAWLADLGGKVFRGE